MSAKGAVRYVAKCFNLRDETVRQWFPDLLQEAELGLLEGEGDWFQAKRRVARFVHRQILKKGLTGGHGCGAVHLTWDGLYASTIPGRRIPVIALARLLYGLLGKRGKRGRRSAALKAVILADRADGLSFKVIADLRGITVSNTKRHYRMAWTLLRHYFIEHADVIPAEQRAILFKLTRDSKTSSCMATSGTSVKRKPRFASKRQSVQTGFPF